VARSAHTTNSWLKSRGSTVTREKKRSLTHTSARHPPVFTDPLSLPACSGVKRVCSKDEHQSLMQPEGWTREMFVAPQPSQQRCKRNRRALLGRRQSSCATSWPYHLPPGDDDFCTRQTSSNRTNPRFRSSPPPVRGTLARLSALQATTCAFAPTLVFAGCG
jgi:hypothetical protein